MVEDSDVLADAPDAPVVDRPTVELVDPPPDSVSVTDQRVTLRFSEAMNRGSVEAAIPMATAFVWSDGDRLSSFDMPFPFADTATTVHVVVPATVSDAEGDTMGVDAVFPIGLAAVRQVVLEYVSGLTGNMRERDTGAYTWFMAGDFMNGDLLFGGISFPLDTLPAYDATLGVYEATFSSQVTLVEGNLADPALGGWVLDHVEFTTRTGIAVPVMHDPAFVDLFAGTPMLGDAVVADIHDQLESSWAGGASHFQLRFHPRTASLNGAQERVYLRRASNDSTVDDSLANPDPENRARLVIRYFVP